ncbi:phospholipase b-like [Plakobranchus ocellatus]|uniref:Phospholipase B-like n=1 Tax=Plakobranchus ocellatus TaxID=259542 RepID=A0AAV4ADM6_9GAST|nr:phospholipase b-like [Plakobranchus ocellatus]
MLLTSALRMMSGPFVSILIPLIVIAAVLSPASSSSNTDTTYRYGSVYCKLYNCTFKDGVLDFESATAVAAFNDTLLIQGWGILDIKAGYEHPCSLEERPDDGDIVFGAGYAEGILTAHQINNQMTNLFNMFFPKRKRANMLEGIRIWMQQQELWANQMILENPKDYFWQHVNLLEVWLHGLFQGYKAAAKADRSLPTRDLFDFRLLQACGSIGNLITVTVGSKKKDTPNLNAKKILEKMYESSRCSALIKLLPGFEQIFLGHSTWFRYESTARIFKTYDFNLKGTVNKKISFSSYGGNLESLDDFYMVDGKFALLQTSNSIFNSSLYDLITPQSLLTWQRVLVANWLAQDGQQWADLFSRHNSGTYNNQYMVLDLRLAQVEKPLRENTLWVVEQIPGMIESRDLTHVLRDGYFASYNIPYFDNIYNISGYPRMALMFGHNFSYELAPRAKIFRRDQSNIRTLQDMKDLLRYNDYRHDPYSDNDPGSSICSRADLNHKTPVGCYDTKVTNVALARQNRADIIGGPTLGTNLSPFSWTGRFAHFSHQGLPQTYNFSFISVRPRFNNV